MTAAARRRFYNVREVAEILGVSTPTLYREIRAGRFPAIRVRGRYAIPARAIDELERTALALIDPDEGGGVYG
jgi:excisionase family DNA binding protein